ncbi:MAG: hypothetical protein MMC33_009701 [Icmadophila ericetorum]|nr:hypothetical protein [Icmadophila ericetorum]
MVVPAQLFSVPFASAKWKKIGWAIQEFRQYMLQMIADEKKLIKEGKPGSNNLVSNLVRAAEDSGKTHRESRVMKPLSVDEILGNIFVFNFAGHDTTAISLSYSMLLLVANPEVQDWLSEEIQAVLPSEHWETWDYQKAFPELRRCLAVLLETLRLYNPLPGVPKWTGDSSQTLEIMQRTCVLPPRTLVVPALQTLHTHPRYWGSDSLTWRPSRWIQTQSKPIFNVDVKTRLSSERLLTPIPGTFIAWSEGVRNCPGKKFAQVEFVATMARLFHSHRVTPIPKNGEIMLEAQRRVLDVVKDSNVHLLLQMRNPGSVAVKWTRKEDMAS